VPRLDPDVAAVVPSLGVSAAISVRGTGGRSAGSAGSKRTSCNSIGGGASTRRSGTGCASSPSAMRFTASPWCGACVPPGSAGGSRIGPSSASITGTPETSRIRSWNAQTLIPTTSPSDISAPAQFTTAPRRAPGGVRRPPEPAPPGRNRHSVE
jgi:hypothetical protein